MLYLSDPDVTLHHGDVLATLRELPAESVDCVVTSPPYWGLRDYGQEGQLGLEPTPEQYVERMVEVFREVRRVLAPHGTVWLNLGDSYAAGTRGAGGDGKQHTNAGSVIEDRSWSVPAGLKPKDLVGIPWRVAFALQADGWYLRSDIIWSKPNPMPESVTDRPTKAHEYVFLLSKQPRYFFDQEAVREPAEYGFSPATGSTWGRVRQADPRDKRDTPIGTVTPGSVMRRTSQSERLVCEVPPKGWLCSRGAGHDGPCAASPVEVGGGGSADGTDPGTPGVRQRGTAVPAPTAANKNERTGDRRKEGFNARWDVGEANGTAPTGRNIRSVWEIATQPYPEAHFATFPEELARRCIAAGCPENGTVLDPFVGSGTVPYVARKLGRHAVGIDLNESYLELAARRLQQQSLFAETAA